MKQKERASEDHTQYDDEFYSSSFVYQHIGVIIQTPPEYSETPALTMSLHFSLCFSSSSTVLPISIILYGYI